MFCFSKTATDSAQTLESLFLLHWKLLQDFMMRATCKSTRYGLAPKATMKRKSCRTYISTLRNVICEGSEFAIAVSEILLESTEEQFIREQHLTFDKVKNGRRSGRLNIYQPAFRKLFEWLKHEAGKEGCSCPDCQRTCELLLSPEKQAEEQRCCCRNCGCGHHFTAFGTSPRTCHVVDARTGAHTCLGRRQCMSCMRYFPNCRFHRMVEVLTERPDLMDTVNAARLFACNFCFVNKTFRQQWFREVRRPLELGQERLDRGIRKIASEDLSERKLLKEMREESYASARVDKDDLLTHREVATVMQTADENIDRLAGLLQGKKLASAESFLQRLDKTLSSMCLHRPMQRQDRDLVLAATRYHVGSKDDTMATDDCGEVFVDRKRRKTTI